MARTSSNNNNKNTKNQRKRRKDGVSGIHSDNPTAIDSKTFNIKKKIKKKRKQKNNDLLPNNGSTTFSSRKRKTRKKNTNNDNKDGAQVDGIVVLSSDSDNDEKDVEVYSSSDEFEADDRKDRACEGLDDSNSGEEEDYIALIPNERREEQSNDRESERDWSNYPWWEATFGSSIDCLQTEVEHFVHYLQPAKHEILLRHYLVHKIRFTLQQLDKDIDVHVFGSFQTNTFLPDSDIDLVVETSQYPSSSLLHRLANHINNAGLCQQGPQVIEKATVPVIKFEDSLTGLKVDIILNSLGGVECARYVSDKLDNYPGSRQLTLIVKHILALRDVNEVFTGGLGGFGIVCLVISFLQMHPKVASGMIDPEKHLGVLLLDFLQLYGINFAVGSVGISVNGEGSYYRTDSYCPRKGRRLFSIRDPLDFNNDIAIKSFNAVTAVKIFRKAYLSIARKTLEIVGRRRRGNSNGAKNSCLLSDIGFIPESMSNQRELMQEVFQNKAWASDPAASSFDWQMSV